MIFLSRDWWKCEMSQDCEVLRDKNPFAVTFLWGLIFKIEPSQRKDDILYEYNTKTWFKKYYGTEPTSQRRWTTWPSRLRMGSLLPSSVLSAAASPPYWIWWVVWTRWLAETSKWKEKSYPNSRTNNLRFSAGAALVLSSGITTLFLSWMSMKILSFRWNWMVSPWTSGLWNKL